MLPRYGTHDWYGVHEVVRKSARHKFGGGKNKDIYCGRVRNMLSLRNAIGAHVVYNEVRYGIRCHCTRRKLGIAWHKVRLSIPSTLMEGAPVKAADWPDLSATPKSQHP